MSIAGEGVCGDFVTDPSEACAGCNELEMDLAAGLATLGVCR